MPTLELLLVSPSSSTWSRRASQIIVSSLSISVFPKHMFLYMACHNLFIRVSKTNCAQRLISSESETLPVKNISGIGTVKQLANQSTYSFPWEIFFSSKQKVHSGVTVLLKWASLLLSPSVLLYS